MPIAEVGGETYLVPDECMYTKDHEWVKSSKGSTTYLVGITDYAAKMLNDIVYVNLPKEGAELKQKEVYGQVESVKTVSDMFMPVAGKIIRTNSKLTQTPELVTNSPYEDGWMLEIQTPSFDADSEDLLDANTYSNYISTIQESHG